jgi:hypothetical protein
VKTTVVNIKTAPCQVYVGRAMPRVDAKLAAKMGSDTSGLAGLWGNPFGLAAFERGESIALYAQLMRLRVGLVGEDEVDMRVVKAHRESKQFRNGMTVTAWRMQVRSLAGKVLGCWCRPEACHGDVLAELAAEAVELWGPVVDAVGEMRGGLKA